MVNKIDNSEWELIEYDYYKNYLIEYKPVFNKLDRLIICRITNPKGEITNALNNEAFATEKDAWLIAKKLIDDL